MNLKRVKSTALKTGKKGIEFLCQHKSDFIQIAFIAAVVVLPHATGFASDVGNDVSTGLPWDTGLNTMQSAITGKIPKVASGISIATGGMLWMFGQTDIAKTAMRATLGSGVVLASPSVVKALVSSSSGCLF
jgi:type IV secretory pathway VirB2 component (pilin)